jgi:predicted MPP superfamily phosphohydrolase
MAASGAGYSLYAEPHWLSIDHVDVPIPSLPAALHGIRIAQLSDLHASSAIGAQQISQAVAATLHEQPDLIVLTGDYVTSGLSHLPDLASLANLQAPLGVYAVLGNHDHWTGNPQQIAQTLINYGIQMLHNTHVQIRSGGAADLWLAGVDDVWEQAADLSAALHGIPVGATTVLLAHEPDFADTAAQRGIHLQLSGHSHGGQVRLPLLGAPVLPWLGERYPIGLQRVAGTHTQVYTNRGIGMVTPAVRFNCRPEVTILRLVKV